MASVDWPTLLIGAIPGCIALGAALVGYGKFMNEVKGLGGRMAAVEADVAKLADLKSQMATVIERTESMKNNMQRISDDVGRITGYLLDEARVFAVQAGSRPHPPRSR